MSSYYVLDTVSDTGDSAVTRQIGCDLLAVDKQVRARGEKMTPHGAQWLLRGLSEHVDSKEPAVWRTGSVDRGKQV
jgi:hypothetical protein